MKLYVQFSDAQQTEITSWFAGPQDPEYYPNQGEIDSSDTRWATFYHQFDATPNNAGLPAPTPAA